MVLSGFFRASFDTHEIAEVSFYLHVANSQNLLKCYVRNACSKLLELVCMQETVSNSEQAS